MSRARACWPSVWRASVMPDFVTAPYHALQEMRALGGPVVAWIYQLFYLATVRGRVRNQLKFPNAPGTDRGMCLPRMAPEAKSEA